jgi:hypothetical protein
VLLPLRLRLRSSSTANLPDPTFITTGSGIQCRPRAFAFFGGIPVRISYDNSKVTVGKITGNRERAVTAEFQRLQSHFLFEEHFCLVRRPNEKGHVERLLNYARRKFLVPVPRVRSLRELNEQLVSHCEKDLERTLRGKPAAKQVLLAEEQLRFRPLPEETFEARRIVQTQTRVLLLPPVERRLRNPHLPNDLGHARPRLMLTQSKRNLLLAVTHLLHPDCPF